MVLELRNQIHACRAPSGAPSLASSSATGTWSEGSGALRLETPSPLASRPQRLRGPNDRDWNQQLAAMQRDLLTGERIEPAQRVHNLVEEIVAADEAEIEFFGLGEHHRSDFLDAAPAVILAAAAKLSLRQQFSNASPRRSCGRRAMRLA